MDRLFISWFLVLSIGCVSKGSPRIDELNNENSVEYHYRYAIDESKSKGPIMDRWEHRVGEYVKGAYSVMQPDGRVRTVDYEVDGEKGYRAIIRMSEPRPELLSIQQLTKAAEVYPRPPLPTPQHKSDFIPQETQSGKWWNYHSNVPHVNQLGSKGDYKASATNIVTKSTTAPFNKSESTPLSPANFNLPQTTNLIHFLKPAGDIVPKGFTHSKNSEDIPFKLRDIKPFVPPNPESIQRLEPVPDQTEQFERAPEPVLRLEPPQEPVLRLEPPQEPVLRIEPPQEPVLRLTPPQNLFQRFEPSEETPRRRRNSRLVRRFKSFAEAFS